MNMIKCHNCKCICYPFGIITWSVNGTSNFSFSVFSNQRVCSFGFISSLFRNIIGWMCFVILGQGINCSVSSRDLHGDRMTLFCVTFMYYLQCLIMKLLFLLLLYVFQFVLTRPLILYFIFIQFQCIAQYTISAPDKFFSD